MDIRPCQESDLPLLDQVMPLAGAYGHGYRLEGQRAGRWDYLVAFSPLPVGVCLVHWDGPVDEAVSRELPDCADITNLHVLARARGRGVGRALLSEAGRAAAVRGHVNIGVGVADDNPRARKLYEAVGFRPSGSRFAASYEYVDAGGRVVAVEETGDYLVKLIGS